MRIAVSSILHACKPRLALLVYANQRMQFNVGLEQTAYIQNLLAFMMAKRGERFSCLQWENTSMWFVGQQQELAWHTCCELQRIKNSHRIEKSQIPRKTTSTPRFFAQADRRATSKQPNKHSAFLHHKRPLDGCCKKTCATEHLQPNQQ